MSSVIELWDKNKDLFYEKKIQQILRFIGEGKLKDKNNTSQELRQFLEIIPTSLLIRYADECLGDGFKDSGLVLQDIVNQIGIRLGFRVKHGRYRGSKNEIGFDGLWISSDSFSLVVEVKTTDAYRIDLNKLAKYRTDLANKKDIKIEDSSVLIVVGRNDTGDLESQIRGSRHAWDIRLISTDALLRLLILKEKLNDAKTSHQINSTLRPLEYTKVDRLIDLVFVTAQDLEIDDEDINDIEERESTNIIQEKNKKNKNNKQRVNFHSDCVTVISKNLKNIFIKESKTLYKDKEGNLGFSLAVSKEYNTSSYDAKYWYAFHPYQRDFLNEVKSPFVTFGCGSSEKVVKIPFRILLNELPYMWVTENDKRMYWHVNIFERDEMFMLQIPKKSKYLDITKYII